MLCVAVRCSALIGALIVLDWRNTGNLRKVLLCVKRALVCWVRQYEAKAVQFQLSELLAGCRRNMQLAPTRNPKSGHGIQLNEKTTDKTPNI